MYQCVLKDSRCFSFLFHHQIYLHQLFLQSTFILKFGAFAYDTKKAKEKLLKLLQLTG